MLPVTTDNSTHDVSALSQANTGGRLIVVVDDNVVKADRLLRQIAAARGPAGAVLNSLSADQRADKIIRQSMLQIAATALVPAHFNWMIMNALSIVEILRIARVYGASLDREQAGKLLTQLFAAAGTWFVVAQVGSKFLPAAVETTGFGYVGGVTLDLVVSAAQAYALGVTTKAYFRGEPSEELGKIMRSAFKQARKELNPKQLAKLREEARIVAFDYAKLQQVLASEVGRNVVDHILQTNPEDAEALTMYMSEKRLDRLADFSVDDLKALDDRGGIAHELWELLCEEVDMPALLEVAGTSGVDVGILATLERLRGHDVDVRPVACSATAGLQFPLGHPRPRVVYVVHPGLPAVYYPIAHFHRFAFEHKFAEAVRLVESLGATEIEVMSATGWSQDFAATLSVPLGFRPLRGEAEFGGRAESRAYALFKATYKSTNKPTLPDNPVWYAHEPTWRQIAEGRLKYGLRDFSLDVRYQDNFGINAKLAATMQSVDPTLDLGGAFVEHQATIWRIVGLFGDAVAA
jgi:uncharacterized protein (DUF697 family)